jgi:hypothetical protein
MAKPKRNMKRTMVFLKLEHIEKLKQLHTDLGVKPAESIRRALDMYLSSPAVKRGRR